MEIGTAGLNLIKAEEGFMPRMYKCAAGKDTIGYGHVILPSEPHLRTAVLTQAQALDLLKKDITARYGAAVAKACTRKPTQNQFDAMVSLAFNIGTAGFAKSSVLRLHNAGTATAAMMKMAFGAWNKVTNPKTGVKAANAVLTRRRATEAALYLS